MLPYRKIFSIVMIRFSLHSCYHLGNSLSFILRVQWSSEAEQRIRKSIVEGIEILCCFEVDIQQQFTYGCLLYLLFSLSSKLHANLFLILGRSVLNCSHQDCFSYSWWLCHAAIAQWSWLPILPLLMCLHPLGW